MTQTTDRPQLWSDERVTAALKHGWAEADRIKPTPAGTAHPFKGKIVQDIQPTGSWWNKGWIIYFTDGTWFSTHAK